MNKILNALLYIEWRLCKDSDLVPEYDQGDSWDYAQAKKQGVGLSSIEGERPATQEIWAIPQQWLDEQPTTTEIKEHD